MWCQTPNFSLNHFSDGPNFPMFPKWVKEEKCPQAVSSAQRGRFVQGTLGTHFLALIRGGKGKACPPPPIVTPLLAFIPATSTEGTMHT